jgi:hypothetical protein
LVSNMDGFVLDQLPPRMRRLPRAADCCHPSPVFAEGRTRSRSRARSRNLGDRSCEPRLPRNGFDVKGLLGVETYGFSATIEFNSVMTFRGVRWRLRGVMQAFPAHRPGGGAGRRHVSRRDGRRSGSSRPLRAFYRVSRERLPPGATKSGEAALEAVARRGFSIAADGSRVRTIRTRVSRGCSNSTRLGDRQGIRKRRRATALHSGFATHENVGRRNSVRLGTARRTILRRCQPPSATPTLSRRECG